MQEDSLSEDSSRLARTAQFLIYVSDRCPDKKENRPADQAFRHFGASFPLEGLNAWSCSLCRR